MKPLALTLLALLPAFAQEPKPSTDGVILVHVANTAGTLLHTPAWRAVLAAGAPGAVPLVRAGIGLYGLDPGPAVSAAAHGLEPAMRLVSEVSHVRRIAAGTPGPRRVDSAHEDETAARRGHGDCHHPCLQSS